MIHRAMVFAAGRGTRLAPLTDRLPKPLAPVADRPLLEHVFAALHHGGIREVVVNLHHLGDRIVEHVGDGQRFGLRVQYSREATLLDTGGGLKRAEPLLRDAPFVVVNGDSLLDLDVRDVIEFHEGHGALATMVVRPDPDAATWGPIDVDPSGRVRRVSGAPADATLPPGSTTYMFPGMHVFTPAVFDYMDPPDRPYSITRVTYPRLLTHDVVVRAFPTEAAWITIDTPAALAAADTRLRGEPFRYPRQSGMAARS